MLSLKFVSDFMFENFEGVSITKQGTHFQARCRLCGDSKKSKQKKRFHLDWKAGKPVFRCWNCDESGSFFRLYMLVKGVTEEQARNDIFRYDGQKIVKHLTITQKPVSRQKRPPFTFNDELVNFIGDNYPVDSILSENWLQIIRDFKKDRQIDNEILYAWDGKYMGRLIIPIFDDNKNLIYFQARRLPKSGIEPKYKNPVAEKQNVILNKNKFDRTKSIIITEGLLDAFTIGKQGTTCLGKELSADFLEQIYKFTDENVILAFDNDEDGIQSMKKFMKTRESKMVKYFLMPDGYKSKDINKLKIDYKIDDMYSFVVNNSYELYAALLKLKYSPFCYDDRM